MENSNFRTESQISSMMSFYFMASISIKDEDEYKKYLEGADEVFAKYRGTYLAVDDHPQLLEGRWGSERAVLIRFDTKKILKPGINQKNIRKF